MPYKDKKKRYECNKRWRLANKKYYIKYNLTHKKNRKQYHKQYQIDNKKQLSKYHMKYYLDNKNDIKQKTKQYHLLHPIKRKRYQKDHHFKYTYGISIKQRNEMIIKQGYECLSCHIDLRKLKDKDIHIDHNHKTNKIRGILCNKCNFALGLLEENPDKAYGLWQYIISIQK